MSKLYVFAIGGTGSRVLRSLTMLMASGVRMEADAVVPIIIDPDHANADLTRAVTLMDEYRDIRASLTFNDGNESRFFRTELTRTLPNYTLHIDHTDDQTFERFVGLASLDKAHEALMRMLFSQRNLSATMDVGFKGNPNIGSVVLNQVVGTPAFEEFATSFAQGDRVFIISSIFGGTGAAGFPMLLKTLRTGTGFPNHALINSATIGAVTVLPYFKLHDDDGSEIDSSTFISKAKSALTYYEHNICDNRSINALYYLADDLANTYNNNEGGSRQRNDAHLVEFLAATAAIDFAGGQFNPDETVHKEFGVNIAQGDSPVNFTNLYAHDRALLYGPMTQLVMMANCLTDEWPFFSSKTLDANASHLTNLYSTDFMRHVAAFCSSYKEWLHEMKGNKRSLDLFNLRCGKQPFEVVTGVKAAKWSRFLKRDYDLIADRLNRAVRKAKGNEPDRFMQMYWLATQELFNKKLANA